MKLSKYMGTVD